MHVSFTGAGRDALDHALSRAPDHLRMPLIAVRDFSAGLIMVAQGLEPFVVSEDRPHVVIIGDDLAHALGPAGFHRSSVEAILARACAVVVVAGEPVPESYTFAVSASMALTRDAIVIETRPERLAEWSALIDRLAPTAARAGSTMHKRGA